MEAFQIMQSGGKFNGRLPDLFMNTSSFTPMLHETTQIWQWVIRREPGKRSSHVVNIAIIADSPVNP